jgi:Tfp pilus assembly protein PilN
VLRSNLSTRPFYNERAVHLAIALAALLVAVLTGASIVKLVSLSRHNTELATGIGADRQEAERLTREAARIRRGIDQKELALIAAQAREANALIDQRTFSWTELFNQVESTLPPDVMLTSVRPTVDDSGTRVTFTVVGRSVEDIDEFLEKLEATGVFEQVLPGQGDKTDDGLRRQIVQALYVPHAEEKAGAEPASKPGAAAQKPATPAKPPAGTAGTTGVKR